MIPLFKVFLPQNLGRNLQPVFDSGFITEGQQSDELEKDLSDWFGNPYVSLTNSGTAALTLAYKLAGVGPGTEVISTPMTCSATNEPIQTLGGTVVWADINPKTGNIDPQSIKSKISRRTVAVTGVHWSGLPFDLDGVKEVCKGKDIKIIEDAAHAFGATYKGKKIGSLSNLSDYCCFSFQAIKHFTTIDGGAIMSSCIDDDKRIKKLRWFGLDRKFKSEKWAQDITESGFKFHMNNVNAAVGLEQMCYIDSIVSAHIENGKFYDEYITNPKISKLQQNADVTSAYWIYTVIVDNRDAFRKHLNSNGIACDIVHFRNDNYTTFESSRTHNLPGVDYFCDHMINVPVGWWVDKSTREHIVATINSYR